ncbi:MULTISPECIES: VCBS repeat-containing protein [Niastella]|uniref:VCBS repeat-containing protein n=1 Tax=Niastella soli TaxID=2821487 RepID=A0ABS3YXI3_9BACT|nr:VCBS repeat-containing protein [Niastella soli]MBO9202624.1 VCBS repeat-containing protein [Niastella soli]
MGSSKKQIAFGLPVLLIFVFSVGCKTNERDTLFTSLPSIATGIHFINQVNETDSTHSFINEFGYMGGGVGIGDFNNDGLKDIYFTGNQVSSTLYLNKGNNSFEDITAKAGCGTSGWATGVSIVDINNDGYDDIYVCVFGKNLLERAANLLFINQHDLTFKESAAEYGLADTSYSTQAVFVDYDKDGDLDMYLANYLLSSGNANTIYPRDRSGQSLANDKLYRNEGVVKSTGHPVFTDVSLAANIKDDGYGLGVVVSDFNNDNWPDIYVANDFLSNDILWLNNRNGTFTNCIGRSMQHQSYSSMGADAADVNNDGWPDVVTLDMMPENNERRKLTWSVMNYERYQSERSYGYEPEFMRNMLQLNNGALAAGDTTIPFFSEIGQLAGISSTDWSWSVLMADFDNDGWKDMHITNGIGRDFINADFLEFSSTVMGRVTDIKEQRKLINNKLASLHHVELGNYLYRNNGNYTFTDVSQQAGVNEASMSNGAAWADLDNDGDVDLVVNNINKEAFVLINRTNEKGKPVTNHSIAITLKGNGLNRAAFGAKVKVYTGNQVQEQEQSPVRGYFSTVDTKLLFGVGSHMHVDSIVTIWPDDTYQVLRQVAVDSLLVIPQQPVRQTWRAKDTDDLQAVFSDVTSTTQINYRHVESNYNDFAEQRLLPQKFSQLGPYITTADLNHDGLTDLFAGGAFNFSGQVFIQQKNGQFKAHALTDSIKMEEDQDCIFFDADGDGDPDLLITSGNTQMEENSAYNTPRLYTNDGKGNFQLQPKAIPAGIRIIAGCVQTGDYDGDGQPDLFIGSRVTKRYPLPGRSYILHNDKGVFTDVTANVCPALQNPGMITAAVWTDLNNDHRPDLVIAGEWMPVRFFKNNRGHLQEMKTGVGGLSGMWRSLAAADIDHDGDIDLVAGNLGMNCDYQVSDTTPMELYAADLDGNGSIDPIPFYYIKDQTGKKRLYPAISRRQFADQVPAIKKQFLHHAQYAQATFNDIFKDKDSLHHYTCTETRSCWFENTGNGQFRRHYLPPEAQFAPVNAILVDDFDGDGVTDLLLAGNEYQTEVMTGRYDASYGCFLKGIANKNFLAIPPTRSGFIVRGDVKDMALITTTRGQKQVVVAINNDYLKVMAVNLMK